MGRLWILMMVVGCSDYQVHKRADFGPVPEAEVSLIDTAVMALDTGDAPLAEDTAEPEEPVIEVPDEPVYLHEGGTLYSWSPLEGRLRIVGNFFRENGGEVEGVTDITDIAIDASGHFYGVSYSTVYGINGHTAEVWPIASIAFPMFGLTCTYDGRLIGAGDGLFEIDTVTGAISTLVPEGQYETAGDIVGLPDGLLYWAVREGEALVVVDPDSGVVVPRGEIGTENIYGLGYAEGSLYGFTEEGQALEISPTTGEVLSEQALPGAWWGATTNPVVW
jgi:hypothetical protein